MIEIISIGSELLTGQTVNTNASVIGQALLKEGYSVKQITTVSDCSDALQAAVVSAMKRAAFVITTGGLGPTGDDITRTALAEIFDSQLKYDPQVAVDLEKRYGSQLETLVDQATVLEGAQVILNTMGTAPGFILQKERSTIFSLPGVPVQMQEMLEKSVIPYLMQHASRQYFQHSLFLFLISEQHVDPYLRKLERKYPGSAFGICPSYGILSIYLQVQATSLEEADQKFAPILQDLRDKYKERIFSEDKQGIEHAVHSQFISRGLTLACAESCTGGRISSRLTQISGSSNYFLGSLVTYSNKMKETVLGVHKETLNKYGAVSREVILEMIEGILGLSKADYAIAVSGVAGPTGGSKEKPVGTIWGAIAKRDSGIFVKKFILEGKQKRSIVIDYSTTYLLAHLWRYVQFGTPPFEES